MNVKEAEEALEWYEPYEGANKMKVFFQRESGIAIIILFNPNILGITKLKDLINLSSDELRNIDLYYRTRDQRDFMRMLSNFRKRKDNL